MVASRAAAIADAWEGLAYGPAVPAFASVVLRFDPLRLSLKEAEAAARGAAQRATLAALTTERRVIEVPTRYDGADVEEVATRSGLSVGELIAIHSGRTYQAFFLGFLPGFAYLGTLDPRIVAPRLLAPRPRVPAGSVAVAGGHTAVYPLDSPGGWRLIGRTALALFDPQRDPPALLRAGDAVRFVPIR